MKNLKYILVVLFCLLFTAQAQAYSYKTCGDKKIKWDSNSKTLYANTTSFPAGYWENGIRDTVNAFNRNPSKFRYGIAMDSGGVGRGNGQSEIWGWPGSKIDGAPAVASQRWTCYWLFGYHAWMNEVDVIYNYDEPFRWTASTSKNDLIRYKGTKRSLQTTGAHELGHGLILNHVNTEYNVMGADFEHIHVNGSTARAYIGEDASDGAVYLYGDRGGWQDVGVVHWKYSGPSGEYSDHTKTVIYNSSGAVLPSVNVNGEIGHRVTRGQWVQVEFTFENNGSNTQSGVNVGFFISTNDTISTGDRRVAGRTLSLGRDNVLTTSTWVLIPSDLTPNTNYWIGAVVDETGSIAEAVEWNNATYIPIYVQ
ncbi:MAG: hypothetical protein OEZ39_03855 [Gammaproteobacteria bacterium]|nr:hypothetical protein [Gammaproteobacteria bacterium]MDH5650992.1 hypothetical protein [Gammaproteobacteria bacterium]